MKRFSKLFAVPLLFCLTLPACAQTTPPAALPTTPTHPQLNREKKIGGLLADWFKGSHPDTLLRHVLQTYTRDYQGYPSKLELVSAFRDLPTDKDLSKAYAAEHGFHVVDTAEEALTLGTGKLAVDGVFLCTEWAPYPLSDTGQIMYPHRRLFEDTVKVFKKSGKVAPVFIDKHIADTWVDSKWIYDTAKEMKIPLMAGSSVQLCLLASESTVEPNADLTEIVGISYHTLTTYGFHGLEMTQALAEQRKGGETGIKRVRCITGKEVWEAAGKVYDPALLDAALEKVGAHKVPAGKKREDMVAEPILFAIEYVDGLKVNLFTLNGLVTGWSSAWSYKDGRSSATLLASEATHDNIRFDWLMKGVEDMYLTGKPSWPVERTLMTSGVLDAALISKRDGGKMVETPYLQFAYKSDWTWRPPAEMMTTKTMPKPKPLPAK